jgi:transposase
MQTKVIGIDLAKNIFHVCAVNGHGKELWNKRLSRAKAEAFIREKREDGVVLAMESCGGANHWARIAGAKGTEVRLIPPQYVKPYVKSQKNDYHDAQAICEAALRPHMRFASIKTVPEQDIQSLHRYRELLVSNRTMVINHSRGILTEYGIVFPKGSYGFRKKLISALDSDDNNLTIPIKGLIKLLYEQLTELEAKISTCEQEIENLAKPNPLYKHLLKLPGVGKLSASALLSSESQAKKFKSGRQFSAYLGLVPRQNSSGGKTKLLGITKHGDTHLRQLLIHGARSVIRHVENKTDEVSLWTKKLIERRGKNKATVALANKNARLIWAIMQKQEAFVW